MRLLLDTQVWLWWLLATERLNEPLQAVLAAPDAKVFLSAASAWEVAIKYGLGKLPLPEPPVKFVPSRVVSSGVTMLNITFEHALFVQGLSDHHRAPFDRLLVAQANVEGFKLVTADEKLTEYDVDIVWAGMGRSPRLKA